MTFDMTQTYGLALEHHRDEVVGIVLSPDESTFWSSAGGRKNGDLLVHLVWLSSRLESKLNIGWVHRVMLESGFPQDSALLIVHDLGDS